MGAVTLLTCSSPEMKTRREWHTVTAVSAVYSYDRTQRVNTSAGHLGVARLFLFLFCLFVFVQVNSLEITISVGWASNTNN